MSGRYLAGLQSARVADLVERFGQWWLAELLNLFPNRTDWLVGRNQAVLVVTPEHGAVSIQLLSSSRQELASSRIANSDYSPTSIDDVLQQQGLARTDVRIGLRLPLDQFFARSLLLPAEAGRSLHAIVVQDLARKTPFRLDDVYHDYCSIRLGSDHRLRVHQWVIRKALITDALASVQLDIEQLAFVEAHVAATDNMPQPIIALQRDRDGRRSWVRTATLALLFGTAVLAFVAAGVTYWRQQLLIDGLASELAVVRTKAQAIRALRDKVEQSQATLLRLRARRAAGPGLLDVWNEATRVLPAHTWLTELRLQTRPQQQDQHVVLIGFSAAAASLVRLLSQSPLFGDAALTAPVSLDPLEGRERFVLQATVKRSVQRGGS